MKFLIETMQSNDVKVKAYKRVAVDAVYALAVHCKTDIINNMDELFPILDKLRTDKDLKIRSAA